MTKYIKLFESATANGEEDIDQLYLSGMFDLTEYVRMYAENGLLNSSNCARTFWNMNGIRVYNLEHCHFADSSVIGGYDLTFANMRKYVMMMYEKYGLKFVYSPQWDVLFVAIDGSHAEITEHRDNPIWPYIKDILGPIQFNSESDKLPDFSPINESLEQATETEEVYSMLDSGMLEPSEAVEMLLDSGQISSSTCASIGIFRESPDRDNAFEDSTYYGHVKFDGQTHGINLDVLPGFDHADVLSEAFAICSKLGCKYAYRKISPFAGRIYDMKPEGSSSFSREITVHDVQTLIRIHQALGLNYNALVRNR